MELISTEKVIDLNDKGMQRETISQLKKDFTFEGINLETVHVSSFKELYNLLRKIVVETIRSDENALYRLLYRIDIPESLIRQRMELNAAKDADEIIAGLIIAREYQKVVMRKKYSTDGD